MTPPLLDIGELRRSLFVDGSHPWNAFVCDKTAELELEWKKYFQPPPERKNTLNICTCKYIHFDPCHCPCHKPPSTAGCQCELDHRIMEHCRYECQCVCHAKPTPAPSAVEQRIEWLVRNLPDITKPIWKTLLQEFAALVRQEGK